MFSLFILPRKFMKEIRNIGTTTASKMFGRLFIHVEGYGKEPGI
jgi:hypothetical protein